MTATIDDFPTLCPHGAEQADENVTWMNYADGCWTTSRGEGVRSIFHLDDTAFRSITLADYLRDWDEALVLNAGDELYDEAARLNRISDGLGLIVPRTLTTDLDICGWCGGLAVLNETTNACDACHDDALDHMDHLGEVPWTDRVED